MSAMTATMSWEYERQGRDQERQGRDYEHHVVGSRTDADGGARRTPEAKAPPVLALPAPGGDVAVVDGARHSSDDPASPPAKAIPKPKPKPKREFNVQPQTSFARFQSQSPAPASSAASPPSFGSPQSSGPAFSPATRTPSRIHTQAVARHEEALAHGGREGARKQKALTLRKVPRASTRRAGNKKPRNKM